MVKCPGCKLPVFKNEGCDSISCSNCQTKFLYSTGKAGGHGSGNAKINIQIDKKTKLSTEYSTRLSSECVELIVIFEALEPIFKSKDMLLPPVRSFIKNGNKNKWSIALAKEIDTYTKWKYANLKYRKYSAEVTELIINNDTQLKDKLVEIITLVKT